MEGPVSKVAEVRVPGVLTPFAAGFKSALLERGYTPLSAVVQLRLMVHLSRWMDAQGLSAAELTAERVQAYVSGRRAAGYRGLIGIRAMEPLMLFLAGQGVVPPQEPRAPESAVAALTGEFEQYLLTERGLAASTVSAYVRRSRRFLDGSAPDGDLARINPADVTAAISLECATKSVGAGQYFIAALRAFLRFAHVRGLIGADLSTAALSVTGRRASLLPAGLPEADTDALLRSCDRSTPQGLRDFAILTVLLRLGLRAGEAAALRLEDIDWRAGEIMVRGKGNREDRLPLPVDVGEAITDWLRRGRPARTDRAVFVTSNAPIRALTRGSVSLAVRRASVRAGITPVGAHRLRHSAACAMIRAEVPLAEVGQVLRQHSPVVTAGYARVDIERLRTLSRPWPGTREGGVR
jgi:site-specific recombinase XerD